LIALSEHLLSLQKRPSPLADNEFGGGWQDASTEREQAARASLCSAQPLLGLFTTQNQVQYF